MRVVGLIEDAGTQRLNLNLCQFEVDDYFIFEHFEIKELNIYLVAAVV
jgi:hypothetical protein